MHISIALIILRLRLCRRPPLRSATAQLSGLAECRRTCRTGRDHCFCIFRVDFSARELTFGVLDHHFCHPGALMTIKADTYGSRVGFLSIFGGSGDPMGDMFSSSWLIFLRSETPKLQLGFSTCFSQGFSVEITLKWEAQMC